MSYEVCLDGCPPSVTEEALTILFSECGAVRSVQVFRSITHDSPGIASVQMASEEGAKAAVRLLNHVQLDGSMLLVFRPPECRPDGRIVLCRETR